MPRATFEQLLQVYRNTAFDGPGGEGTLTVQTEETIAFLRALDQDEDSAQEAGISLQEDPAGLTLGGKIRIGFSAPRLGIGLLVGTFDQLLLAPKARFKEPAAYFVIDKHLERNTTPPADLQTRYRKVLALTKVFSEAASYLDRTRQDLVFFRDGKFVVPLRYDSSALAKLDVSNIDRLLDHFKDIVHQEQKLAILTEAIAHVCESQPIAQRFVYLLENIGIVAEEVRNGYRLFASSFSYAKIRSEVEAAKLEFVGKIHKTFIDIQGQLLGIPVATIIVASQLKVVTGCGLELWTNVAVLGGAWIFVLLLILAIINQWLTLSALWVEIGRQKAKLVSDYAAISDKFTPVFAGLEARICWHRGGLLGIGIVALIGAGFATFAYAHLTTGDPLACWSREAPKPTPYMQSGRFGSVLTMMTR